MTGLAIVVDVYYPWVSKFVQILACVQCVHPFLQQSPYYVANKFNVIYLQTSQLFNILTITLELVCNKFPIDGYGHIHLSYMGLFMKLLANSADPDQTCF